MEQLQAIVRKYKKGASDEDYLKVHEFGACVAKYEYAVECQVQEYIDKKRSELAVVDVPSCIDPEDVDTIRALIAEIIQ